MDFSSDDYCDEADIAGKLSKHNSNDLGFFGGPAWRYPEEEIEFFYDGELEAETATHQIDVNEKSSDEIINNFRIAMIEYFIHAHELHDDDHDLSSDINRINHALSPPSSPIVAKKRHTQYINKENHRDGNDRPSANTQGRNSNTGFPQTFQSRPSKNQGTLIPNVPGKRRSLRVKDTFKSENATNKEPSLYHFQEAAMCVPFEYTTKNATFYIRRPYGLITVPEIFRAVNTQLSDEEYKKQSRVSSSHTIEVAIAISADNSSMLLYGSAGVRFYKTDPSVDRSGNWVDIPDVDAFGTPLGYVNKENHDTGNYEYSLDEILEEAMFVREQYCNSMLCTVSEAVQRRLYNSANYLSPPSLAKSIVSTPPRSSYYYDGSSNIVKDDEEEIKGQKLDFIKCISPSLMTRNSNETIKSRSRRKGKQRNLYQLLQRVFIAVAFYACGIFLVSNISAVDHHRTSHIISELPSYKPFFAHNLISSIFQTGINDEGEQQARGNDPSESFQISEMSATERTESDALIQRMTEERNYYRSKFETSQNVLQRQLELNKFFTLNYYLERTKTEELQKRVADAIALIQNLRQQKENFAVEQQMLKETTRKLEIQIMALVEGKRPSKKATDFFSLETASAETNSQAIIVTHALDLKGSETQIVEELIDVNRYQGSRKDSSETTTINFMGMRDLRGENRSIYKNVNLKHENEQLCAADEPLSKSPKNEMLSIENVILRSALSKKGPIFPKLYRKMTRRFSSQSQVEIEGERGRHLFTARKKIKGLAGSVKNAILDSARKVVREI